MFISNVHFLQGGRQRCPCFPSIRTGQLSTQAPAQPCTSQSPSLSVPTLLNAQNTCAALTTHVGEEIPVLFLPAEQIYPHLQPRSWGKYPMTGRSSNVKVPWVSERLRAASTNWLGATAWPLASGWLSERDRDLY